MTKLNSRRWTTLAVCLIGAFMTLLDISIVNVALPSIQRSLHVSQSGLQWILSGYILIYGLVLVPAGRLGDTHGRKMVFTIGLGVFILASVAAGVSTGELWIIIARLGQGIGAGVLMPQITGLIQQIFPPPERGKAFGLFGAVIGVATAVGPLMGGIIIQLVGASDGWRWLFGINVPIGIVALPLSYRLIPGLAEHRFVDGEGTRRNDLDLLGIVLLGLAMVLLLLPVVQIQQWHGNSKWLLTVVGVVLFAVPPFIQRAGVEAIRGSQSSVTAMLEEFRRRRDLMVEGLNRIDGISCRVPSGAFYVFPNIRETRWEAEELASAMLDKIGVAVLAGTSFGDAGRYNLRISYANSEHNLRRSLVLIKDLLASSKHP